MPRRRARRARKGGFLPLLPLLAAGIPAIMGTVAGAMDIAHKAKQLKEGSGMRRKRAAKKGGRMRRRRGKGVVSDFVSRIPLLGSVLGPLARGIGLGLGNLPYNSVDMKYGGALMPVGVRNSLVVMDPRRGGLLSPAGGMIKRRSHYRRVRKGGMIKRVHVRSHLMKV